MTPTLAVFAYFSNLVLLGDRNSLLYSVAIVEHVVLCLTHFISFAMCGGSCTFIENFRGVEYLVWGGINVSLPQGICAFMQDVGFFEDSHCCSFDITRAYLVFSVTVELHCSSGSDVWWLSYSAVEGVVSDILAREVPERKHSMEDEIISQSFYSGQGFLSCGPAAFLGGCSQHICGSHWS